MPTNLSMGDKASKATKNDIATRDAFLAEVCDLERSYLGGIRRFHLLTAKDLKACIDRGWADPDETQNNSPDIESILEFLQDNPVFTCHGYIVGGDRDDIRLSVEGVQSVPGKTVPMKSREAFVDNFRHAYEFEFSAKNCYAWYN